MKFEKDQYALSLVLVQEGYPTQRKTFLENALNEQE
jgi:hypothetical protein